MEVAIHNRINYKLVSRVALLENKVTKEQLKETILNNFRSAKDEDVDRVLIYYPGHADEETGGWISYGGTSGLNCIRL